MVYLKRLIKVPHWILGLTLSPSVSSSPIQACPGRTYLICHPLRITVRRPLVDARLEAIRRGEAGQILAEADDRERPRETWAVGVSWSKFTKEDLLEIVEVSSGPEANGDIEP